MEELFDEYTYQLNTDHIQSDVKQCKIKSQDLLSDVNILKQLFNCIDLTTLNATDSIESVTKFVNKVNAFEKAYPEMPSVAALCVYPNFAQVVRQNLKVDKVNRAVVSAGFPASQTFIDIKVTETSMAMDLGANEIDIVISVGEMLNGNHQLVFNEIKRIKEACSEHVHLKVILETGALKDPELIWKASILAMEAGADFIKTSTGKMDPAATPEAAYVMCQAIKAYYNKTQRMVGLKPAGGIAESDEAAVYYEIVNQTLGAEWLTNKWFRIGASRLANNLLSDILTLEGKTTEPVKFF